MSVPPGWGQLLWRDIHLIDQLAIEAQLTSAEAVRMRIAATPRMPGTDQGPICRAIEVWQNGALTRENLARVLAAEHARGPSLDHVVFGWTCEQLVRLDTHPGVLCAPASTNGGVRLDRLANRIAMLVSTGSRPGPMDLLLSLTRLQLPETADGVATALEPLSDVALFTEPDMTYGTGGAGGTTGGFDVVPVIWAWVGAGGMSASGVPIDLRLFGPVSEADLRSAASHPDVLYRVWPPDPEELPPGWASRYSAPPLPVLVDGVLPSDQFKPLLAGTISDHAYTRDRALARLLAFAQHEGVLAESVTVPMSVSWLRAGHLPLGRFTDALQWLFERGGLRELWSLGTAVAAAASAQAPKPAGLPSLLGCLSTYASEVPPDRRRLPPEISELAGAKTSSKSRAAARDLVTALNTNVSVPT